MSDLAAMGGASARRGRRGRRAAGHRPRRAAPRDRRRRRDDQLPDRRRRPDAREATCRSRSPCSASARAAARCCAAAPSRATTILVTGPLGRSAAGLRRRREGAPLDDELVVAHRRPWPRLDEGVAARSAGAHAMMDLSDGLGAGPAPPGATPRAWASSSTTCPVADGATFEEADQRGRGLRAADRDRRRRRACGWSSTTGGCATPITIGRVVARRATRTLRGRAVRTAGLAAPALD